MILRTKKQPIKINQQKLIEMLNEAVRIQREFHQHFANGGTIEEFKEKITN